MLRRRSCASLMRERVSSAIDRKSTRLNSSHLEISYAVFCLKKKTIRHREPTAPAGASCAVDRAADGQSSANGDVWIGQDAPRRNRQTATARRHGTPDSLPG